MCRSALLPPNESMTADLNQHLVETVINQAHLCPLTPLEVTAAVHAGYDAGMQLPAPPEVLVLAQRTTQFSLNYQGTAAFNPGSFFTSLSWMVYHVHEGAAESSTLQAAEPGARG